MNLMIKSLLVTCVLFVSHALMGQAWNNNNFWIPISDVVSFENGCNDELVDVVVNCNGTLFSYRQYYCKNTFLLIKSTDQGKNWRDLSNKLPRFLSEGINFRLGVQGMFIEKEKLYIVVEKDYFTMGQKDRFLLLSKDEGNTWTKVLKLPEDGVISVENDEFFMSYHRTNNTYSYVGYLKQKWQEDVEKWISVEELTHDTKPFSSSLIYSKNNHVTGELEEERRFYYDNMSGVRYESLDKGESYAEAFRDRVKVKNEGSMFSTAYYDKISRDEGVTWVSNWLNISVLSKCQGLWLGQGSNKINETGGEYKMKGNCISRDRGNTWEPLKVSFPGKINFESHIGPDGYLYHVIDNKIVRSAISTTCDCSDAESDIVLDYGTTIITHGMLVDDFFPADGGWMDKMATAILTKANYGRVYFYKKETGEFVKLIDAANGADGEDIILFDWSDEALEFGNGSTEAAADALFAALIAGNGKDLFDLTNLHFIGHGRGCIVNSLTVERIYHSFIPKVYGEQVVKEVSISQVTNLGPFDAGHNAWWEPGDIKLNLLADDIDDAHPEIEILTPKLNRPNNGVIAWKGIYSDTYWQNNGKLYLNNLLSNLIPAEGEMTYKIINELISLVNDSGNESLAQRIELIWKEALSEQERSIKIRDLIDASLDQLSNFKKVARKVKQLQFFLSLVDMVYSNLAEREVEGTRNINWKMYDDKVVIHPTYKSKTMFPTEWVTDFIGICDAYIKSIEEAAYGQFDEDNGGFSLSRLNGYDISPDLSSYFGNDNYYPNFDYFETLDIPGQEEDRIRGIMNGSFDRTITLDAPGWAFHGGGHTDYPDAVLFNQGYASLTDFYHFTEPVFLRHNRFYIPHNANSITFKAKTESLKEGTLIAFLIDPVSGQKTEVFRKDFTNNISDFESFQFDVKAYQDKVVLLEFSFQGTTLENHLNPKMNIDDVSLSQAEVVVEPSVTTSAPRVTEVEEQIEEERIINSNVLVGISNGTFSNLYHWDYEGGEVAIEKEAVSLKPVAKRRPVTLKHEVLEVPQNIRSLAFQVHKEKVTKADFLLIIREVDAGVEEVVYSDNIRINIMDKLKEDVNELGEGIENLDFDSFKEKFTDVTVNMASYRGKAVEIIFEYTAIGNGKQKLYIDNVVFE